MSWAEVKKAINTEVESPINHLLWLMDYKTFGEDSYVFRDKRKLYELYQDMAICVNDRWIAVEVFEYCAFELGGVFLSYAHGLNDESRDLLRELKTVGAVFDNNNATTAIFENDVAREVVLNSDFAMRMIANNDVLMNKITSSSFLMNEVSKSEHALFAITNSVKGRTAFMNSPYVHSNYSNILNTCEVSNFFIQVEANVQHSSTDSTYYINGNVQWGTNVQQADKSIVLVSRIYNEGGNMSYPTVVTSLANNSEVKSASKGWSNVEYVFLGGLSCKPSSTSSNYDEHGVTTTVFKAK